jgi:hypothetical protein
VANAYHGGGSNVAIIISEPRSRAHVNFELPVLAIAKEVCALRLGGSSYRYGRDLPVEPVRIKAGGWRSAWSETGWYFIATPRCARGFAKRCWSVALSSVGSSIARALPRRSPIHATTVHSAEGMRIGNAAFVDVDDFARTRHRDDTLLRLQLLYVAATRPREALVMTPALDERVDF